MHSNHLTYSISLKEQEDVQEIISQLQLNHEYTLDPDLEALILSSQADIQAAYDARAEERMLAHRQGIDFEQLRQLIEEEQGEQIMEESVIKEQRQLAVFQKESVLRSKLTQRQILQLDSHFPKLNYNSMVGQQQSIFILQTVQASKWISHRKLTLENLGTPITSRIGEKVWIVMGIANQLLIFRGIDDSQPQILQHNGNITAVAFSPCKKYLAAAIQSQIVVYEIRKNSNIVLLKNVGDLKIKKIVRISFYQGGPRLFFIDQTSRVGVLCIEVGMILTKVRIDELVHTLPSIQSCQAIGVNDKGVLIALAGGGKLRLGSIQPQISFNQQIQINSGACLLWRKNKEKLQLLLGCENKLTIYKLVHLAQQQCYFLQEHLLFLNHYNIQEIFLISEYHVVLTSQQNFTVVALPLIPTVVEYHDLLQSEGAIVFVIVRQDSNTILSCADESLVVFWKGQIQMGRLKTLQQSIDELMIHQCAYRQALSLLVLVSKGINYSFKFSYEQQALKNLISGAIQMCASALTPSLDKKIVLFRVGWVVQLCIQCKQQKILWNSYYQMLKQKNQQKMLFQMLQIFILKNQISSVPEHIFLQMVAFYAERNQEQVIQKLVLTNKEQFEATKLLGLLNQKQMNYLQFYLFSRGILSQQYDFYTPFLRAFTAFSRNTELHSPKKNESGLLCFLILSKSFCFQHVPNGYMTRDIKQIVVKDFFVQTLSKPFLKKLSQFNFRLFCEVYLLPFINQQFKDILFEDQNQILSKFKEMTNEEDIKADSFIGLFIEHMQNCIGANRNSSIFAQLYATILYITDSSAKFQRIIEILAILFQKKFYKYELRLDPQIRPGTKKLKEYLIRMIQQQLYARSDRLYIKKLLVFQDREVGYLLHRIDRNFQLALQHYLGNHGTDGLFSFIQQLQKQAQLLPEDSNYQKTRKKLQIRNFLIRNIGLLFRTDSSSALQILYTVGQTTQKIHDHIFNAHFEKQQRLHFLTAVLTRWEFQQFQHKQKYLLQHLEQVCGLPEKQMRNYLDKFYYPLDQAIRVADHKGNNLAKAILQTRSGMIQEAFSSYQKLIKNTLILNKGEEETRAKVNRYIQECVELCKLFSGENFQENLWIRLMKFISSFVASEHQYKVYLKVELQRSNQAIIAEMLRFLGTQLLIEFFTSPSIPLPFYKLVPIHQQLIRKVKFDKIMIQRTKLIFKKDLQYYRKLISRVSRIAARIQDFCDFCKGKLSQQQTSIAFFCSHSFHTICHDDHSKCLTCIYESDDLLFQKAIFKKNQGKKTQTPCKKKNKTEINTDIIVQTKSQAMILKNRKRLKFYDYQMDAAWNRINNFANNTFEIDEIVYYM